MQLRDHGLRAYLQANPAAGYTMVQVNGDLSYRNVRIMSTAHD